MDEPTKDELLEQAEAADIDTSDDPTKAEIEERLAAANPPALGATEEQAEGGFEEVGTPIEGVQPETEEDIPDAGR